MVRDVRDKPFLSEAVERFTHLYLEARKSGLAEPAVATLATVDGDGRPSVRSMTISYFDEDGFIFFTSSGSRKSAHLEQRPVAAICFFWEPLNEQFMVEGPVEKVADSDAEKWWMSCSRDNQFAAWASEQSARLDSRDTLQKRLAKCREQFIDGRVPKPPHWCGYRLRPQRMEFWHGGWRHLHERVCYELTPSGWDKFLLSP